MIRKYLNLLVAASYYVCVSWFPLFLPTSFYILMALVAPNRRIRCPLPACPFSGGDSGLVGPGALLWRRDVWKWLQQSVGKKKKMYRHKWHHVPQMWTVAFNLFTWLRDLDSCLHCCVIWVHKCRCSVSKCLYKLDKAFFPPSVLISRSLLLLLNRKAQTCSWLGAFPGSPGQDSHTKLCAAARSPFLCSVLRCEQLQALFLFSLSIFISQKSLFCCWLYSAFQ